MRKTAAGLDRGGQPGRFVGASLAVSAALVAAGCFSSTKTDISDAGLFVKELQPMGPTVMVHQCAIRYAESTTHEFSLAPFFLAFFSIEADAYSQSSSAKLTAEDCVVSSVSLRPVVPQRGPGASGERGAP